MINNKKLMVSILIEASKMNDIKYCGKTFGVDEELFVQVMKMIDNEKYIINMKITTNILNKVSISFTNGEPAISMNGYDFIRENGMLVKTYKGLKEIRDWLPF